MRLYFFGPRFLGMRTGVSFGPSDFAKLRAPVSPGAIADTKDAFIYVITGDHNRCKVGITANPEQRLMDLQTGSPFPLRFAWIGVPRNETAQIEGDAHQMLDAYKTSGEWFNVTPDAAVGTINAAAQRRGHAILGVNFEQAMEIRRQLLAQPSQAQNGLYGWFDRHRILLVVLVLLLSASSVAWGPWYGNGELELKPLLETSLVTALIAVSILRL